MCGKCEVCIVGGGKGRGRRGQGDRRVNTEKAELLSELCEESGHHGERPPRRLCPF